MIAPAATAETLPEVLTEPHTVALLRKRVLITGGGGMLATDLAPVLAGAGMDVFARPRSDLDITSERHVSRAFVEIRPQVVVNCAAFTRVDACEENPDAFDVNARGVEILAQACRSRSIQLVQISTDFVFDGQKRTPYQERDPTGPQSAYGASKLAGEEAALRVPTGLVVRSSWLFGNSGWNFVEAILKQVEEGRRELKVVSDQRGRPTATADLSEAVLALLAGGAVGVYHFANRGEATWFDFACEILAISGHASRVRVQPIGSEELGRPARRPSYSVLDTTRYEKVTGQPIRHFREPLAEYLARRARPQA